MGVSEKCIVVRAEIRQERKSWSLAFPKIGGSLQKKKAAALRDSALRCASVQSWLSVTLKCLTFIYLFLQFWCSSHRHKREGALQSNSTTSGAISRSYSRSTDCASTLLTVIKNDLGFVCLFSHSFAGVNTSCCAKGRLVIRKQTVKPGTAAKTLRFALPHLLWFSCDSCRRILLLYSVCLETSV